MNSSTNTFQPIPSLDPSSSTPLSSSSSSSFFSMDMGWKMWALIIFILALLGINIFVYLARGTQTIADFIKPITSLFLGTVVGTTKEIINVSATGVQAGVRTVADTVDSGLNAIERATDVQNNSLNTEKNALNAALNEAQQHVSNISRTGEDGEDGGKDNPSYQSDDSHSTIQKGSGKSGWCYIGEDRGFRSCVAVGENDKCMSGDIFPTQDVCVNPSLRA